MEAEKARKKRELFSPSIRFLIFLSPSPRFHKFLLDFKSMLEDFEEMVEHSTHSQPESDAAKSFLSDFNSKAQGMDRFLRKERAVSSLGKAEPEEKRIVSRNNNKNNEEAIFTSEKKASPTPTTPRIEKDDDELIDVDSSSSSVGSSGNKSNTIFTSNTSAAAAAAATATTTTNSNDKMKENDEEVGREKEKDMDILMSAASKPDDGSSELQSTSAKTSLRKRRSITDLKSLGCNLPTYLP